MKIIRYIITIIVTAGVASGTAAYIVYEKYYRPTNLSLWETRIALDKAHIELAKIYPEYEIAKKHADSIQTYIPLQSGLTYPMESIRQYYYHQKMFTITYDAKRYLEQKRRVQSESFLELADHATPFEKHLVAILDSIGVPLNDTINSEKNAQKIMDFAQCIPYQPEDRAYTKMPIETLFEGGGDCEDLAVLSYSLLLTAGIDAVLVIPTKKISTMDHATVAIAGNFTGQYIEHKGKRFYIAESAGTTDARFPKKFRIGRAEKYNVSIILGDSIEVSAHETDWIIKEKKRR